MCQHSSYNAQADKKFRSVARKLCDIGPWDTASEREGQKKLRIEEDRAIAYAAPEKFNKLTLRLNQPQLSPR